MKQQDQSGKKLRKQVGQQVSQVRYRENSQLFRHQKIGAFFS